MTETSRQNYGCIIGIDFGTTYSGCCYCHHSVDSLIIETAELEKDSLKEQIRDISDSSSRLKQRGLKTPTVAIYDQNMKLLHWGNAALEYAREGIQDSEILLQKFKLNLPTTFSQRGARQIFKNKEQNVIAQSLVATIDFFKILFAHAYYEIYHKALNDSINYNRDDIRFIITVPAVWNDTQRAIMRDIAYEAGLISQFDDEKKLQIINESLASTLYCEHKLRKEAADPVNKTKKDKLLLQEGDIYITCDAGGGTVDIAVFAVTKSIKNKMGLSRCQISADSGDKCGSTYIDLAMEKLLMKVLYHPEIDHFSKEQEIEASKSVAKLIEQFSEKGWGSKFNFGEKRKNNIQDDDDDDNDYDYGSLSSSDDGETSNNEEEENEIDIMFNVTSCSPTILWTEKEHCTIDENYIGIKTLRVPFKKVAEEVFDDVINKTCQLLDMQIEKMRAKDKIKAMFLVGGLGNNPYFNQKLREYFCIGEDKYKCGMIINDDDGDMAAMKGAVHYGIESVFGTPEANIATWKNPEDRPCLVPSKFDGLMCFDIGYDFTHILFTSLPKDASLESGPQFRNTEQNSNMNGATTLEMEPKAISLDAISHMQFNKVLSFAKADLKALMVQHLKVVCQGACDYLKRTQQYTNQENYRYCITLENSYEFFTDSNEIRDIAIQAGLICETEDDQSRLLVLRREDAAALYIENCYFTSLGRTQPDLKKHPVLVTTFLQIQVNSENCHLSLYEASKVTGNEIDQHPRNVRCIRKTTYEFNCLHNVMMALQQYLNENGDCFSCDSGIHTKDPLKFDGSTLKRYLTSTDMDDIDFSMNSLWKIKADGQRCCQVIISGFNFLQNILRPVMDNLAATIVDNAVQAGVMEFRLDKVFLIGKLLPLPTRIYEYVECTFTRRLSECMDLGSDLIMRTDKSDLEVAKGALLYGLTPSTFTERIARRTYMVSFEAFAPKFTEEAMKRMELITDQDERYDAEAKHVIAGDEPVKIYYQPAETPSSRVSVRPMDLWVLMSRGDGITPDMETSGIQKKFFTEEDAIVYASIYFSETAQIEGDARNSSNVQKIHQFELYLKRQTNSLPDEFGIFSDGRLHFNICTIPAKNDFKFEITLDVKVGAKVPEFRYRDEFFVSSSFNHQKHITSLIK